MGSSDGPQPKIQETTNSQGRLDYSEAFSSADVGGYVAEQVAVGTLNGTLSNPLSFTVSETQVLPQSLP